MARGLLGQLYIQVLNGIAIAALGGVVFLDMAALIQPLADAFIKSIKTLLAPVIDAVAIEIVSTFALMIGLVVVDVVKPGVGMNIDV